MEPAPSPAASPWSVRDPVFIYLATFVASLVGLIAAAFAGYIDIDALQDSAGIEAQLPRLILVAAVAEYGAMLLGLKLLSDRKGTGNFRVDYHLRVSSSDWIYFVYGMGVLFLAGAILSGIFELLNIEAPTQEVVRAAQTAENIVEKGGILIAIAVFAPILEEMLFRGVLLDALKVRLALNPAIWITGVVFGIVHLTDPATLTLVPALVGLGVLLGYVRERGGGSLSRPILMHMGFNFVSAVALVFSL